MTDLTVFRCIQESMTNAVRHGRASNVTVRAQDEAEPGAASGRALRITIRDDGAGVPEDHGLGLGLSGMRERVEALGGTFGLDNGQPGAVVRIMIPLDREPDTDTSSNARA